MPLSKAKMRERKRRDRVKPMSNLTAKPLSNLAVTPDVKPKLAAVGLKLDGNRIIGFDKQAVQPRPPLYNPAIHGPGDTVLLQRGKRMIPTIIPRLDADGNPMPW